MVSPGQVQGSNHYPSLVGHTISKADQDAIDLGHLGTLMAHVQPDVDTQVLFCWETFQTLFQTP